MKTKIQFLFIMAALPFALNAQEKRDLTFFNDVRISYVVSSMDQGFDHFRKEQSLIPYGLGIETSPVSYKRFSLGCGFQVRTTGNNEFEGIMYTDNGYSGPFSGESYNLYFDIPVHISYEIFKYRFLEISILAGTRTTYMKSSYTMVTDHEEINLSEHWDTGYEFGITEAVRIFKGLSFYASQSRNKYFGERSFLRTIDLDFGLILNFR